MEFPPDRSKGHSRDEGILLHGQEELLVQLFICFTRSAHFYYNIFRRICQALAAKFCELATTPYSRGVPLLPLDYPPAVEAHELLLTQLAVSRATFGACVLGSLQQFDSHK